MSSPADVDRLVGASARRCFRRLHVLVNNAGVYGPMGADRRRRLGRVGAGDRDQPLRLGAAVPRAAAALQARSATARSSSSPAAARPIRCRASAPTRRRRRRSSGSPRRWPIEVREVGIDVNAIAPGALNTRLLDEVLAAGPERGRAGVLRAHGEDRRRRAARRSTTGAALAVFLGVGGERRHHRPADQRGLGSLGASCPSTAASSTARDVYTLRRIVPEGPRHDVGRQVTPRRRDRRLRADRPQAGAARSAARGSSRAPTSTSSAREALARHGAGRRRPATDWRDAVAARDVDVVIVATTNDALAPSRRWRASRRASTCWSRSRRRARSPSSTG